MEVIYGLAGHQNLRLLVFNCGSSSLKFELIILDSGANDGQVMARGIVDRIGPDAHLTVTRAGQAGTRGNIDRHQAVAGHAEAAALVLDVLGDDALALDGVAHRIVHGGPRVTQPASPVRTCSPLWTRPAVSPLHNPPALKTLRAVQQRYPGLPAIVVADTGFHRDLPPHAHTYAIPHVLAARHGIRRFGFHGVGHAWMLERYAALTGRPASELNLITLQLGAGCSVAAIRQGISVDTSMGLTPWKDS